MKMNFQIIISTIIFFMSSYSAAQHKKSCSKLMSDSGFLFVAWAQVEAGSAEEAKFKPALNMYCKAGCYAFCDDLQKIGDDRGIVEACRLDNSKTCDDFLIAKKNEASDLNRCFIFGGKHCTSALSASGLDAMGSIVARLACHYGDKSACDALKTLKQQMQLQAQKNSEINKQNSTAKYPNQKTIQDVKVKKRR